VIVIVLLDKQYNQKKILKILVTKIQFIITGIIFGMFVISIPYAEAKDWNLYVGKMPKHWESQFGNLLFYATQYWQEQFPNTKFYKVSNLENADFVVQWASEYQADEKTNTKKLGYYTTNTKNEYGRPYVAITLGFMTGDGLNKKFELVDEEYALLITIHEIGHAIGLKHNDEPNNIMYPSIYNYEQWLLEKTSNSQQDNQIQYESPESSLSTSEIKPIPDWIKNDAKGWADGQIDDNVFVGGIQFLIKEGIIQIQETSQSINGDSQEIPAWIKNNADWWSQGLISDDDFLKGVDFMVENGIIIV